jgi:hypothetical protein
MYVCVRSATIYVTMDPQSVYMRVYACMHVYVNAYVCVYRCPRVDPQNKKKCKSNRWMIQRELHSKEQHIFQTFRHILAFFASMDHVCFSLRYFDPQKKSMKKYSEVSETSEHACPRIPGPFTIICRVISTISWDMGALPSLVLAENTGVRKINASMYYRVHRWISSKKICVRKKGGKM